ncbi:unnamed protein product [Vitrella brassicaformis CCMP3155]|uniref:General transcription and DNA repair factor IIH subunit TFB5 n=1 Tax=Vitrella brassicaformis (strain CCMP3155) TaxID=1169540 RepID=A0A0G4EGW6_VITBC|nr:unnamed protein product [Vitrella brassicaformis CCMP3155]|mmetsp:Transcript_11367/g.27499  ORF Transcript_11367/g.27499 Transcript_11367/m.27499 type:complete len:100 (-) Transcript_11367:1030-1329(-)|eukprot:CEL94750.1 unnamed protein product [Vitrella brassicaformis CCMP3155]
MAGKVKSMKGILVECDEPTMEIITRLNSERNFIIQKLDDCHVLCNENVTEFLQQEVEREVENCTYASPAAQEARERLLKKRDAEQPQPPPQAPPANGKK